MNKFKWLEPDLNNLHQEIIQQNQFCCWESKKNELGKEQKIPLVLGPGNRLSYTFPKGDFLTFEQINRFYNEQTHFKPGLYLKDGSLSVIDLDNHSSCHDGLTRILARLFQKGCYIEISPSGQGLHVFYSGSFDWTDGRKRSTCTVAPGYKTTCEVYGPNDVRFITLTGQALSSSLKTVQSTPLPKPDEIMEELLALKKMFFTNSINKISNPTMRPSQTATLLADVKKVKNRREKEDYIYSIIQKSPDYPNFILFKHKLKFEKHNSISETDMAFAGLLARHIPEEWSEDKKIAIMINFFKTHRPERDKYKERTAYLIETVNKALANKSSLLNKTQSNVDHNVFVPEEKEIIRSSIFKICNIMNIFHLGRSYKKFEYKANKKEDNSLIATSPESLNATDFKYFMQLLFHYKESIEWSSQDTFENKYCHINIKYLLKELGLSPGGKTYKSLLGSLRRLSKVHLEYRKLLNPDEGVVRTISDNLLSWELVYIEDPSTKEIKRYNKLKIKMHPVISEVLYKAEYNYSLINKDSYNKLSSEKLQLLYFYFCQNTWPGKSFITFTLKDLLSLWPPTNHRGLVCRRKSELVHLLEQFISQQEKIKDLDFQPVYDGSKLLAVKVKKNRLNPI